MPALPLLSDVKTYLGLTGTGDDALLTSLGPIAIAQTESDTGRTIAASSNTTTRYSANGAASIVIHDRPLVDASRTVQFLGVTYVENTNVWFLPDRRDPNITATVQLRYYDTNRPDWYKADSMYWDRNLDRRYPYGGAMPNDLVITGIIGMPFPKADVTGAILTMWAWLYWRAKSGASGTVATPTGDLISLSETPPEYQRFVRDWRIKTAVAAVG